jgi:hypothetical protein
MMWLGVALLAWFIIGLGVALVLARAARAAEYYEAAARATQSSDLPMIAEAQTLDRLESVRSPRGRPFFRSRGDRKQLARTLFDLRVGRALQ